MAIAPSDFRSKVAACCKIITAICNIKIQIKIIIHCCHFTRNLAWKEQLLDGAALCTRLHGLFTSLTSYNISRVSSLSFQAVAASVTASTLLTSPQQPQRNTTQGAGIEVNPDSFFFKIFIIRKWCQFKTETSCNKW